MTDDEIRKIILLGIRGDQQYYSQVRYKSFHRNRSGLLLLERHKAALQGFVKYEPSAWVGRPLKPIERKQFSCILAEMRSSGLVLCESDSRGRTRYVSLTAEGEELAHDLESRDE